jgi:hypothetical protein
MNTSAEHSTWQQQPLMWLIIVLLGVTILASFAMLFVAMKNAPELVVDNYSNIEEFTSQTFAQDKRARELKLSAVVYIREGVMSISLQGDEPDWPDSIVVRAVNSTLAALDRRAEFSGSQGRYTGTIDLPGNAYDLHIEDPAGSWRLSKRAHGAPASIELNFVSP